MSSVARHLVAGDLAGERKLERVAVLARCSVLREPHVVAVDRAGEVARDEVALVRAVDARCRAAAGAARGVDAPAAYSMRTSHRPLTSAAGGAGAGARVLAPAGFDSDRVQPLGDDLLVAGRHHVRA